MDNLGTLTARNIRTVSLVVTLIDDFTGRVITGSNARTWIENEKPPIKKNEGWSVFVNLADGEYTVFAESGFYNKAVCAVCVSAAGESAYTELKMRLTPSTSYPLPRGTTIITGTVKPNCTVRIYPDDRSVSYKLLSDVKKGSEIMGIYLSGDLDIEGKLFYIKGENNSGEFFRVRCAVKDKPSEYKLCAKLANAYPKIGTLICPVSEAVSDNNGRFFIPIADVPEKETPFVCVSGGGKKSVETAIELKRGGSFTVDF